MSGNIMGLGVVISDIIKRSITHISFVISCVFFFRRGEVIRGWQLSILFPFAVCLEEGHHKVRFWIFALHFFCY